MPRPLVVKVDSYTIDGKTLHDTEEEAVRCYVYKKLFDIGCIGTDGLGIDVNNYLKRLDEIIELLELVRGVRSG